MGTNLATCSARSRKPGGLTWPDGNRIGPAAESGCSEQRATENYGMCRWWRAPSCSRMALLFGSPARSITPGAATLEALGIVLR
jgi:hypothetical protein